MLKNHPWETLSYHQVIDTPYLKIRCEQVAVPNGPIIPDYYIIENRGWVGIVPLTDDGRFLLNNQYKHGIGREVLEFPAGGIDSHEDDHFAAGLRADSQYREHLAHRADEGDRNDESPGGQALSNHAQLSPLHWAVCPDRDSAGPGGGTAPLFTGDGDCR